MSKTTPAAGWLKMMVGLSLLFWLLTAVRGADNKGETVDHLRFRIKYRFISAGKAQIDYVRRDSLRIGTMFFTSAGWLNALWQLRDTVAGVWDIKKGRLVQHLRAYHQGRYHRRYQAQLTPRGWEWNPPRKDQPVPAELLDLPSLLRQLQNTELRVGDTLRYPFLDGRSVGLLRLVVEEVTQLGRFRSKYKVFRLEPIARSRKAEKHEVKLYLMLDYNKPHLPRRIESQTKYGPIVMELVKAW